MALICLPWCQYKLLSKEKNTYTRCMSLTPMFWKISCRDISYFLSATYRCTIIIILTGTSWQINVVVLRWMWTFLWKATLPFSFSLLSQWGQLSRSRKRKWLAHFITCVAKGVTSCYTIESVLFIIWRPQMDFQL